MFHDVYEASQGDVRLPVEETAASGALAMGRPPKNPHVFKDLPTQTSDSLSTKTTHHTVDGSEIR